MGWIRVHSHISEGVLDVKTLPGKATLDFMNVFYDNKETATKRLTPFQAETYLSYWEGTFYNIRFLKVWSLDYEHQKFLKCLLKFPRLWHRPRKAVFWDRYKDADLQNPPLILRILRFLNT